MEPQKIHVQTVHHHSYYFSDIYIFILVFIYSYIHHHDHDHDHHHHHHHHHHGAWTLSDISPLLKVDDVVYRAKSYLFCCTTWILVRPP